MQIEKINTGCKVRNRNDDSTKEHRPHAFCGKIPELSSKK